MRAFGIGEDGQAGAGHFGNEALKFGSGAMLGRRSVRGDHYGIRRLAAIYEAELPEE